MQKIVDRKPKVKSGEVVATDLGWVHVKPNGSEELLVSATGLKTFIEQGSEEVVAVVEEVKEEAATEGAVEEVREEKTRGRKAKAS